MKVYLLQTNSHSLQVVGDRRDRNRKQQKITKIASSETFVMKNKRVLEDVFVHTKNDNGYFEAVLSGLVNGDTSIQSGVVQTGSVNDQRIDSVLVDNDLVRRVVVHRTPVPIPRDVRLWTPGHHAVHSDCFALADRCHVCWSRDSVELGLDACLGYAGTVVWRVRRLGRWNTEISCNIGLQFTKQNSLNCKLIGKLIIAGHKYLEHYKTRIFIPLVNWTFFPLKMHRENLQ